jgi:serine/threonine protein kinase
MRRPDVGSADHATTRRGEPSVTDGSEPWGVASTIHALDATAVALRPSSVDASTAPLVRAICSPTRYESHGRLGEGGMGTVEAVWDADLMRHLAVKRLRPELREDARLVRQFLWEARVTAHLDHPNIVPIHDLAIGERGSLFFTMKRARGETLETRLDALPKDGSSSAFPRSRRLRTFVQICHAISFAHARGVLHRDLKPANVMVGDHGEVLVMDWGLAIPLPGERGDALRALRLDGDGLAGPSGTPLYMSPEQVRSQELDERSDVYALGVMLYEMTSLARPYTASALPELLAAIVAGDTRRLVDVMPDAAPSLVAIVSRAMALETADRYPSVESLREDVERMIDGHTPNAERVSLARRAARLYFSRDRGLSRLRVVDVELLMGSAMLLGAALIGMWLAASTWPTLLACTAVLLGIPPTLRWARERRAEDE